jgi:hypothetical protein
MKDFGLEMYHHEKNGIFPIKAKSVQFETCMEAEQYCAQLNKRLKNGSYWKISRIGSF